MARAKPDRAIAAEIGVSNQTVRRARRKTTVTNVTVGDGKRTGRDGNRVIIRKVTRFHRRALQSRIE
jgi:hypothetical protein